MKKYDKALKRGSLGELEARALSRLARDGKTIFTTNDLKPLSRNPSKMAYDLAKKNWILKLKRGLYAIAEL
ncbi:MAG TPA: type IV toxin-antitoxin system AbiEi family antitoxin domain-containing protein, partial [archaeon]|nr:type IV toxin-antitoxin system AbiEi family antitoxin domain-containing protein [archaeon]